MEDDAEPDMYVLDALADDLEDLESALRLLNSETAFSWRTESGRLVCRTDLVLALSRLIRDELVHVYVHGDDELGLREMPDGAMPPASYDDVYFGITDRGRLVHSNWSPETPPKRNRSDAE